MRTRGLTGVFIFVALLILAIPGMWVFMKTTAEVLHPNPAGVPSVMNAAPSAQFAGAVADAQRMVRAMISEGNLPGLSVAVGVGNELVWAEGFGFADLKTSEVVTPNHRVRIGTASTVLTSAAAGLLMEDGRLKLDDEIQTYVPEFPKKQWPVKVEDVMSHMAGVVPDGGDEGPLFAKHCERPADAVQYFGKSDLLFRPKTQYRFSGYDWILVSAAIETAANQPFLKFMRERVFEPLGMRDTVADGSPTEPDDDFPLFNLFLEKVVDPRTRKGSGPAQKPSEDQVVSYFPRFASDPKYGLHVMRPLDLSCYAGSSVFVSTASDLVRFGIGMNNGKLLKVETVLDLQAEGRLASKAGTGYGLGWDLEDETVATQPVRVVGHDGELLGGEVAALWTSPEQGLVVAVISNISYADTHGLAGRIAGRFMERSE